MNTIRDKESFQIDQTSDDEVMRVNVVISQFDLAEFGFTNDFAINHFGYNSWDDYEFLKRKREVFERKKIKHNIRYFSILRYRSLK